MNDIQTLTLPFDGEPLTTIQWNGQLAWVAREIGRRLGYSGNGKRFVNTITREWGREFIEGTDYVMLTGDELAAFKEAPALGTGSVPSRAGGLLLLLEPGLYLAMTKTNMEIGIKLRRFLASELFPTLMRTGRYVAGDAPPVEESPAMGLLVVALTAAGALDPASSIGQRREERLAFQAHVRDRWVDLCDRRLQVATLHRAVEALTADGLMDKAVAATLEVTAAEIALGRDLSMLKPAVTESWASPSEIAARWGVSPQRVGRVITALGLRGDARFSKQVLGKARGHDKTVLSFLYNNAGVAFVDAALQAAGFTPSDAA